MAVLLLLVLTLLQPALLAVDVLQHGDVDCDEEYCYLSCDGGWVTNGTYRVPVGEDQQMFACVEPATLVIAGYSTKPDASTSGRLEMMADMENIFNTVCRIDSVEVYARNSIKELSVSSLPLTRSYHTATTVGSTVFVTGGQVNDFDEEGNVIRGVYTNTCLKYDFGSDQWSYTGNLSFPRWWHSAGQWRNFVFVFGGRDNSAGTVTDSIEKFNVETEEWSHGPVGTTPVPVYGHCTVTLRERIMLVGGLNSKTNYLASTYSYSPSTRDWRVEQDLQQARVHHACAVFDGGVLVAGGSVSGEYLSSVEWWNPLTHSWQWSGQLVVAREYHSISVSVNTATVFGGFYISGFTNHYLDSLEVFTNNSWGLSSATLNTARRRFAVAQLPATLFD